MALAEVDRLMEQGKSRSAAVDHASFRYGVAILKLLRLLSLRDYGVLGSSGTTEICVVATPSTPVGV